jgi:hypothetical protein
VDELVVADVDPDVRERAPQRVEEHQVAGLQFGRRDRRADAADLLAPARQRQAECVAVDQAHQAAAVESGLGRVAAETVADAEERQGAEDDLGAGVADRGRYGQGVGRADRGGDPSGGERRGDCRCAGKTFHRAPSASHGGRA